MYFFTVSLAVGLRLSLIPYCTPAVIRHSSFPPPLSAQELGLVRANAISISNQRSVRSPVALVIVNVN